MRDYSPMANKAFEADVPQALVDYLKANQKALRPAMARRGRAKAIKRKALGGGLRQGAGYRVRKGMERAISAGRGDLVWNYTTYVESLARAGKEIYPPCT